MLHASVFDLLSIIEHKPRFELPLQSRDWGFQSQRSGSNKRGGVGWGSPMVGSEQRCQFSSLPQQRLLWGHGKGAEHGALYSDQPHGSCY